MKSRWSLVIFDHDGVLVDSEIISMSIIVELMRRYGADIPLSEAVANLTGLTWNETMDVVAAPAECDRQALQQEYHDILFRRFETDLAAIPGIPDLLDDLARAEVPVAIGSAASSKRVHLGISSTGIDEHFPPDLVVTRDHVPQPKPSPDVFLLAAERAGVAVDQCLVVDDSPQGIAAARSAGMNVVGLAYRTSRERLADADWIVGSIEELRPVVFSN